MESPARNAGGTTQSSLGDLLHISPILRPCHTLVLISNPSTSGVWAVLIYSNFRDPSFGSSLKNTKRSDIQGSHCKDDPSDASMASSVTKKAEFSMKKIARLILHLGNKALLKTCASIHRPTSKCLQIYGDLCGQSTAQEMTTRKY